MKLGKIKLPPDATSEQVKQYIDKIVAVSKKQTSYSRSDIQIEMLTQIDHKYLPVLINKTAANSVPKNYHLSIAVTSSIRESDKQLVIKMLPSCPSLIDSVIKFGWHKELKDIIFATTKLD